MLFAHTDIRKNEELRHMIDEYIHTDLAMECRDGDETGQAEGVRFRQTCHGSVTVSHIEILDERGETALGKPRGNYVTLSFDTPWLMDEDAQSNLCRMLSTQLSELLFKAAPGAKTVLVAGLGNRRITADAVGPQTVDRITVTKHLETLDPSLFRQVGQLSVAALTPGVLGDTGMEAAELVARAAQAVQPDAVIAVDALAARNVDRLGCTIQLADSGIAPGAGVGNRRKALSHATVGVPVIALGVPTVVNSATLVRDALYEAGITEISPGLQSVLENGKSFYVTPKESDTAVEALSEILAMALDMALAAPKEAG